METTRGPSSSTAVSAHRATPISSRTGAASGSRPPTRRRARPRPSSNPAGPSFCGCRRSRTGGWTSSPFSNELSRRGVRHLLVEGGARILTSFLESGLVDYLVLTISPRFVGGVRPLESRELRLVPEPRILAIGARGRGPCRRRRARLARRNEVSRPLLPGAAPDRDPRREPSRSHGRARSKSRRSSPRSALERSCSCTAASSLRARLWTKGCRRWRRTPLTPWPMGTRPSAGSSPAASSWAAGSSRSRPTGARFSRDRTRFSVIPEEMPFESAALLPTVRDRRGSGS